MALPAALQWEVRTDGNNNNGSGYSDLGGASVDYTQQAAAELSLTDLAMVTGGTTLTSATGGFAADLVGNCVYIRSGTNFVVGYYQITGYNNGNSVEIDRDATNGANGSNGSGCVGGAKRGLIEAFLESIVAGNTVWVKAATYSTLTAAIEATNGGNESAYLKLYGYNTTRGDEPTGDNRPLIQCGSYRFELGDYSGFWDVRHLRFTTKKTYGIILSSQDCCVINCKAESSSPSANALDIWDEGARIIDCDNLSVRALEFDAIDGNEAVVDRCYCHGSSWGIYSRATACAYFDCICIECYENWIGNWAFVKNCTFANGSGYGMGCDGLLIYTFWASSVILNCIFERVAGDSIADAFTEIYNQYHYLDYNNWIYNEDDLYLSWPFTKGPHAMAVDSLFVDIDNDNAKLQYSSPVRNTGMVVRT